MNNDEYNYWHEHYNDEAIVGGSCLQENVHRTKNGKPIEDTRWNNIVDYIAQLVSVRPNDSLLELCCGNGMLIGPLSNICATAVGVDYSNTLLQQLKRQYPESVDVMLSDALECTFSENSFDVIIMYAAIQYFSEKEAALLIEKCISWLKPNGRLLVGDVPNALQKWSYIEKKEHRANYIQRLIDVRPLIGNWFHPSFFDAVSCHAGNISLQILEQPSFMLDSSFRFDVLIFKTE